MCVTSMTASFPSAAARGLMRNTYGIWGLASGVWGIGAVGIGVAATPRRPSCDEGVAATAGAAGAVAVMAGIGSPGLPRKPTVLCTGTLTPGGTAILISVPSVKLSTSMTD